MVEPRTRKFEVENTQFLDHSPHNNMKPIGVAIFEASEQGNVSDKEKEQASIRRAKRRLKQRKGIDPEVHSGENTDEDKTESPK